MYRLQPAHRLILGLSIAIVAIPPNVTHAQSAPAFKVTSVHFSPAVETHLKGVVTPLEVTEMWQTALAKSAQFRVLKFDEPASAAEFGGALLAASATVTKTDVYRIGIGAKSVGYVAALCALTATFLDPATGEVFYQGYVEVSSPAGFLGLFDQEADIAFKDLSKYYQAVPEANDTSFAKKAFRSLVLSGLEKLAQQA